MLLTGKTFCAEQLKKFCEKAKYVSDELGQWAVDYFIMESIKKLNRHYGMSLGGLFRQAA